MARVMLIYEDVKVTSFASCPLPQMVEMLNQAIINSSSNARRLTFDDIDQNNLTFLIDDPTFKDNLTNCSPNRLKEVLHGSKIYFKVKRLESSSAVKDFDCSGLLMNDPKSFLQELKSTDDYFTSSPSKQSRFDENLVHFSGSPISSQHNTNQSNNQPGILTQGVDPNRAMTYADLSSLFSKH